MKQFILLTAISISTFALSQKIKIDENIAFVDNEAWIQYEKKNMANEASVRGLSAENEEIFITYQNYTDPNEVSKSNPEGKVRWIEIHFLTLDLKCEIPSNTHKGIVKVLYENNIYTDGTLNEENAATLVKKYGTRYSDNRPKGGNVNIIINN